MTLFEIKFFLYLFQGIDMKTTVFSLFLFCMFGLFSGSILQPAQAQTPDCAPYAENDFWLTRIPGEAFPVKNILWKNHLLILKEDGIYLLNTNNNLAPTIQATLSGTFGDLAVNDDHLAVSFSGHVAIYSLPDMVLEADLSGVENSVPKVALTEDRLAAVFGPELWLWEISDPTHPILQSSNEIPNYNTQIGMGELLFSDDYLLGCSYGGNNIGGYHTALSVFDISDLASPIMTDFVTGFPFAPSGAISLFFEIQPIIGGFVLEGLINEGPYRPEYQRNNQILARIKLNGNGLIQWEGSVTQHIPYSRGFIVDGNSVLWTAPPLDRIVNVDWNLPEPTVQYAHHSFAPGKAIWIPDAELLSIRWDLFHLAEFRVGQLWPSGFNQQVRYQPLDDNFGLQLRWSYPDSPGGLPHWSLATFNTTDPDLPGVSGKGASGYSVENFAIIGRRVVLFWMGDDYYEMMSMEVSDDGFLQDPVPCDLPAPFTSIHWDDHDIVANLDGSMDIYLPQPGGDPLEVAHLSGYGGECRLTRVGPVLYVHQPSTTKRVDLHDPENPHRRGTQAPELLGASRYIPEQSLLLAFNGAQLHWFSVSETWDLELTGSWTAPTGSEIRDLLLSGDSLYMALGDKGMVVCRFDPENGPVLYGGNLYQTPNSLISISSMGILSSRVNEYFPLDCEDPLPVMVAGFAGTTVPDGVELRWNCHSVGDGNKFFFVYRVDGGRRTLIGTDSQQIGPHMILDHRPVESGSTLYQLCLGDGEPGSLILAEVLLEGNLPKLKAPSISVYPNPANPGAEISFIVPSDGNVRLSVFSLDGKRQIDLVNNRLVSGSYSRFWNGRDASGHDLATGVYLLRLETEQGIANSRVTMIK